MNSFLVQLLLFFSRLFYFLWAQCEVVMKFAFERLQLHSGTQQVIRLTINHVYLSTGCLTV